MIELIELKKPISLADCRESGALAGAQPDSPVLP